MVELVQDYAPIIAKAGCRSDLIDDLVQDACLALTRRMHCRGDAQEPLRCPDRKTGLPSYQAFRGYIFQTVKSKFLSIVDADGKHGERETTVDDLDVVVGRSSPSAVTEVLRGELAQLLKSGPEGFLSTVDWFEAEFDRRLTTEEIDSLKKYLRSHY